MILMLLLSAQAATIVPTHPPVVVSVSQMALPPVARPPVPRQAIQGLVSPLDYPAGATGRGTVGITLLIDKQGRVVACELTQSGGSPRLDIATCHLLERRARFTPAIDSNGNAAMGRVAVQVDWDSVFRNTRLVRMN